MAIGDPKKYRKILEENKNLSWVKRLLDTENKLEIKNEDGSISTHKMAYSEVDGKYYVYPTIVDVEGGISELTSDAALKRAIEKKEFISFDSESDAQDFSSTGYKKAAEEIIGIEKYKEEKEKPITVNEDDFNINDELDALYAKLGDKKYEKLIDAYTESGLDFQDFQYSDEFKNITGSIAPAKTTTKSLGSITAGAGLLKKIKGETKYDSSSIPKLLADKSKPKLIEDTATSLSGLNTVIGGTQVALGVINEIFNKQPEFSVRPEVKAAEQTAIKESLYGLSPGVKNTLSEAVELNRRSDIENIKTFSGGSGAVALGNIQGASTRANRSMADISYQDEMFRNQKRQFANELSFKIQAIEDSHNEMALRNSMMTSEGNAALISQGFQNLLGPANLKSEADFLKKLMG